MDTPRVAIFDRWWPVHFNPDHPIPSVDDPTDWARLMDSPRLSEPYAFNGQNEYQVRDDRVLDELQRINRYQTCPICRKPVTLRSTWVEDESIYVCLNCGYWSGIGFRDWNSHHHARPLRGVIGRYKPLMPLDHAGTDYLLTHLRRTPKDLTKISPKRAEGFVMDLLSDYLRCEVRALGGVKDGGVDGFILRNERVACIIQVKWRQTNEGAEGVGVVKEVAGTLLARGVPSGILVSTRSRFSKDAAIEAQTISNRNVEGLGKLQLALKDYTDILDMLELSSTKLTTQMTVEDWFQVPDDVCVFDGAARLTQNFVSQMRGDA